MDPVNFVFLLAIGMVYDWATKVMPILAWVQAVRR
jgi:hypothetical protein